MSCGTPDTACQTHVSTTRLSLSLVQLSVCFVYTRLMHSAVHTPSHISMVRFGLFPFRSPLLRKSLFYFLFLRVLRCFSSGGSPPMTILFTIGYLIFYQVGFPIRISTDRWLLSPPRGFSQIAASFVGSWCQGIPLALFVA